MAKKEIKFIKPKAYFIDIDGTLVKGHKDRKLNYDDRITMCSAAKKGTYIILSTGRSLKDLLKIWEQIRVGTSEFTAYGVVNNGSGIYNLNTGEVLFEDYMDEKTYRSVFNYAKEKRWAVKNSQEKIFYVAPSLLASCLKTFSKTTTVLPHFDKAAYNKDSAKKLGIIASASKKKVSKYAETISKKFPKVDVAISGPGLYIEITKKGITKGSAIKFMCEYLDIKQSETVHIGDSMNDAPGFKEAGYGVAMGNSMKELKSVADFITLDRKKSGVANTIKSFGNI